MVQQPLIQNTVGDFLVLSILLLELLVVPVDLPLSLFPVLALPQEDQETFYLVEG